MRRNCSSSLSGAGGGVARATGGGGGAGGRAGTVGGGAGAAVGAAAGGRVWQAAPASAAINRAPDHVSVFLVVIEASIEAPPFARTCGRA